MKNIIFLMLKEKFYEPCKKFDFNNPPENSSACDRNTMTENFQQPIMVKVNFGQSSYSFHGSSKKSY